MLAVAGEPYEVLGATDCSTTEAQVASDTNGMLRICAAGLFSYNNKKNKIKNGIRSNLLSFGYENGARLSKRP